MSNLIRRDKAIDYFVTNIGIVDADGYAVDDYDERVKIWTERFSGIPSAEPVERTAKVIDKSVGRHSIFDFDWIGKCEKCGNEIQYAFDYCPYCGSRLDWSENE